MKYRVRVYLDDTGDNYLDFQARWGYQAHRQARVVKGAVWYCIFKGDALVDEYKWEQTSNRTGYWLGAFVRPIHIVGGGYYNPRPPYIKKPLPPRGGSGASCVGGRR